MSSGEKRKREKDELLNKLLNNSSLTKAFVTSFSVEPCDVPDFAQFREIAKREAGSRGFSKVLMKAIKEYNRRHGARISNLEDLSLYMMLKGGCLCFLRL